MTSNYKKWLSQSAWVYPDEDGDFLPRLLKNMEKHYRGYEQWQSNIPLEEYPQYLCSAKFNGGSNDIVHFWRDGQTWWPISGGFRAKEKDDVELILRKCIDDYANNRPMGENIECRRVGTLAQVRPHLTALVKSKNMVLQARSWLL